MEAGSGPLAHKTAPRILLHMASVLAGKYFLACLPGRRDYEPIGLKFIYKISSPEADLGMLTLYVLLMSFPSLTSMILYGRKEPAGTWKLFFFLPLKLVTVVNILQTGSTTTTTATISQQ